MLVISRKKNEAMVIGNNIVVSVAKVEPAQVSLNVDCPLEYPVELEESGEKINRLDHTPCILARKKLESLLINGDVTVTVVEIREDKVRLGFVLPKELPIHRKEVFEAIHGKSP